MPSSNDILINVRVNSDQAIREINNLLRKVADAERKAGKATRTPAQIQRDLDLQTDIAGEHKGRTKGEDLAVWKARKALIDQARQSVRTLTKELADLQRAMATVSRQGPIFQNAAAGIAPTAAQIKALQLAATQLAKAGLLNQAIPQIGTPGKPGFQPGGAAGLQAALQPVLQATIKGIQQQGLQASKDLLLQRTNLQRQLGTQQQLGVGGGFGSQKTIQDLINVNKQIQDLSRVIPNLRFAGAATQIKQLTTQFQNAGFALKRFESTVSPVIQKLVQEKQRLEASAQQRTVAGEIPTRGNTASQIVNVQRQLAAGATNTKALNREMERLVALQKQYAFQWDHATRTFTHHALRIAEGLILYNAFTRALQGISEGFQLIADIDRDMARLGAVLGEVTQTQTDEFLSDLGNIAIRTATDFRQLLSVTDLVAGSFRALAVDAAGGVGAIDTGQLLEDITGFQEIIGEFTNVIGPGNNPERVALQLSSLFRIANAGLADIPSLAHLAPLDRFRRFMDSVVTLGHRSAVEIEAISAALVESGLAANLAGVDLRFLAAIIDQLVFRTGQSGQEIGTLLRTSLSKLSDPDVLSGFEDIVEGAVETRNAVGELRDADDILIQLFDAVQSGALSTEQARQALQELIPPINPGAAGFNAALIDSIGAAMDEMGIDAREGGGALEEVSLIIANTLPGRFQSFVTRIQTQVLGLQDSLEDTANAFLDFGNTIVDVVEVLGPDVTGQVVGGGAFIAGGLVLVTLLEKFGLALLGVKGGFDALRLAGGSSFTGMLSIVLRRVIPLVAAFELLSGAVQAVTNEARRQVLLEESGLTREQAEALILLRQNQSTFEGTTANQQQVTRQPLIPGIPADVLGVNVAVERQPLPTIPGLNINERLDEVQINNVENALDVLSRLSDQNLTTEETWNTLVAAISDGNGDILDTVVGTDELLRVGIELATAQEHQTGVVDKLTESTDSLTDSQRQAIEVTELQESLVDDISSAYATLVERLRSGTISQQEFAQGEIAIQEAARLSSALVASVGDQLALLPQFAGPAAQGMDQLAQVIFQLMLNSSNSLNVISPLIAQLIAWATRANIAARENARFAVSNAAVGASLFIIEDGIKRVNRAELARRQSLSKGGGVVSKSPPGDINALINQILKLLNTGISTPFGTGPAQKTTPKGPDQSILDMGDLTAAQLQQAVQMALALQSRIPGANAEASDDIISVIKDGVFQQQLQGVDQRLLQIAIEELTGQMEEANRLAAEQIQKDAMLRNLTVSAGPLSALISQPTLFGLGGSFAEGNGLNFDPTKGNFVINVPVELNGLNPAALQELIYNIISKAIQDAARL